MIYTANIPVCVIPDTPDNLAYIKSHISKNELKPEDFKLAKRDGLLFLLTRREVNITWR